MRDKGFISIISLIEVVLLLYANTVWAYPDLEREALAHQSELLQEVARLDMQASYLLRDILGAVSKYKSSVDLDILWQWIQDANSTKRCIPVRKDDGRIIILNKGFDIVFSTSPTENGYKIPNSNLWVGINRYLSNPPEGMMGKDVLPSEVKDLTSVSKDAVENAINNIERILTAKRNDASIIPYISDIEGYIRALRRLAEQGRIYRFDAIVRESKKFLLGFADHRGIGLCNDFFEQGNELNTVLDEALFHEVYHLHKMRSVNPGFVHEEARRLQELFFDDEIHYAPGTEPPDKRSLVRRYARELITKRIEGRRRRATVLGIAVPPAGPVRKPTLPYVREPAVADTPQGQIALEETAERESFKILSNCHNPEGAPELAGYLKVKGGERLSHILIYILPSHSESLLKEDILGKIAKAISDSCGLSLANLVVHINQPMPGMSGIDVEARGTVYRVRVVGLREDWERHLAGKLGIKPAPPTPPSPPRIEIPVGSPEHSSLAISPEYTATLEVIQNIKTPSGIIEREYWMAKVELGSAEFVLYVPKGIATREQVNRLTSNLVNAVNKILNLPGAPPINILKDRIIENIAAIRLEMDQQRLDVQIEKEEQEFGGSQLIFNLPFLNIEEIIEKITEESFLFSLLYFFFNPNRRDLHFKSQVLLNPPMHESDIDPKFYRLYNWVRQQTAWQKEAGRDYFTVKIPPPEDKSDMRSLEVYIDRRGTVRTRLGERHIPLFLVEKQKPGFRNQVLSLSPVRLWLAQGRGFKGYIREGIPGRQDTDPHIIIQNPAKIAEIGVDTAKKNILLDDRFRSLINFKGVDISEVERIIHDCFAKRLDLFDKEGAIWANISKRKGVGLHFIDGSRSLFGNHRRDRLAWMNILAIQYIMDRIVNERIKTTLLGILLGVGLSHEILGHEAGIITGDEMLTLQDAILTLELIRGLRYSFSSYIDQLREILEDSSPYIKQLRAINGLTDPDRLERGDIDISFLPTITWVKDGDERPRLEPANIVDGSITSLSLIVKEPDNEKGAYTIFAYNKEGEEEIAEIGSFIIKWVRGVPVIQFNLRKEYSLLLLSSRDTMGLIVDSIAERLGLDIYRIQVQVNKPPLDVIPIERKGGKVLIPVGRIGSVIEGSIDIGDADRFIVREGRFKSVVGGMGEDEKQFLRWATDNFSMAMMEDEDRGVSEDIIRRFFSMLLSVFEKIELVKKALLRDIDKIIFIPFALGENEFILRLDEKRLYVAVNEESTVMRNPERLVHALLKLFAGEDRRVSVSFREIDAAIAEFKKTESKGKPRYTTLHLSNDVRLDYSDTGGIGRVTVRGNETSGFLLEKAFPGLRSAIDGLPKNITLPRLDYSSTTPLSVTDQYHHFAHKLNDYYFELLVKDEDLKRNIIALNNWWMGLETIFNMSDFMPEIDAFKEWLAGFDAILFDVDMQGDSISVTQMEQDAKKVLVIKVPRILKATISQEDLIASILHHFCNSIIKTQYGYDDLRRGILEETSSHKRARNQSLSVDIGDGVIVSIEKSGYIRIRQEMKDIPLMLMEKLIPGFRRYILRLPRVTIFKSDSIRAFQARVKDEYVIPNIFEVTLSDVLGITKRGKLIVRKNFDDFCGFLGLNPGEVEDILKEAFRYRSRLAVNIARLPNIIFHLSAKWPDLFGNHKEDGGITYNHDALKSLPGLARLIALAVGLSHEIFGHEAGMHDEDMLTGQDVLLTEILLNSLGYPLSSYITDLGGVITEDSPYLRQLVMFSITRKILEGNMNTAILNNLGILSTIVSDKKPFRLSTRFSSWDDGMRFIKSERWEDFLSVIISYYIMFGNNLLKGRSIGELSEEELVRALLEMLKRNLKLKPTKAEDRFLFNYMLTLWRDKKERETAAKDMVGSVAGLRKRIESRTIGRIEGRLDKRPGLLYFDIDKILEEPQVTATRYLDMLERLCETDGYTVVLINSDPCRSMNQILGKYVDLAPRVRRIIRKGAFLDARREAFNNMSERGKELVEKAVVLAKKKLRVSSIPPENITLAIYGPNNWLYPDEFLKQFSVIIMTSKSIRLQEPQLVELERLFPGIRKLITQNNELLLTEEIRELSEDLERLEEGMVDSQA